MFDWWINSKPTVKILQKVDIFSKYAAAKSLQSCPTLCDPRDSSQPGSPIPGILQARVLEWVAISFSSAWKWKVKVKSFSRVWLLATPWTAAYQAPPSMGFSRQEYWSRVPSSSSSQSITPTKRGTKLTYLWKWNKLFLGFLHLRIILEGHAYFFNFTFFFSYPWFCFILTNW